MTSGSNAPAGVTVGTAVVTADGRDIGSVKAVQGNYFKVNAPLQPDYWLSVDYIQRVEAGLVALIVDGADLQDVKLDQLPDDRALLPGETVSALNDADLLDDWPEAKAGYRAAWEAQHGASRERWDEAEPGYRYGHALRAGQSDANLEWHEVEPEAEASYGEWARRHGYDHEQNSWDRLKGHVQEAWNRRDGELLI